MTFILLSLLAPSHTTLALLVSSKVVPLLLAIHLLLTRTNSLMHVIVVGAGPSGLAASLGLSSLGFTVDLLEKHSSFDVRGSTLGLAPNGSKALQEICPNEDVTTLTNQGLSVPGVKGVSVLGWWLIRDWLLERVEKDPNITLHMGVKLISIDDTTDDSKVVVHCQNDDYKGDLVIGADGVHSQVRSLLNLEPNVSTGYRVWRGSVSAEGEPILEALLDKGILPMQPLWGTATCSIFNHHPKLPKRLNWTVTAHDDPSMEPGINTPFDVARPYWNVEEEAIFTKLWERSPEHELTKSFVLYTAVLPTKLGNGWGGRGRVTLIGDAAHAIRPTSGFGTALAFEDCAVLRRKLMTVNHDMNRKECQDLVLDFENERLERVKVISDQQKEAAEAAHRGEKPRMSEEYKLWVYAGV